MDALIMVLMAAIIAASNILCFVVGAKTGQKVTNDEPVELPKVNPLEAYKERKEKEAAQKEQDTLAAILHNVDVYNGTPEGQKEVK